MLFRITGKKILKKKDGIPSPLKDENRAKYIDRVLLTKLNHLSTEMQEALSNYDFIKGFD
jgi:isoleucyl-tRNA synthetase